MAKFDPARDLPDDLIKAVGLLTIYASHLDVGLIAVLAAATRTRIAQADATLHSTTNAKARIDLIKATCDASYVSEDQKLELAALFERAKKLGTFSLPRT